MRHAKSAKAIIALGATLFAVPGLYAAAGADSGTFENDLSGVAGIDAGGALGIDAGGALGIDAGGALGFDAGEALGIDAGGALLGIDAGGALGIDAGGALGIDAGLLLAGPIDSVDRINGVFSSLGQVVMASREMMAGLDVGDFVAVAGSVVGPGWLYADTLSVSAQMYVPGATDVFVSGILSDLDRNRGTARIGDLTIDYTASLGSASAPTGVMWSFGGKRPGIRSVMISETSLAR